MVPIHSTPLADQNGKTTFNASGVVPVSSSQFVFIDNADPWALYELNLNPDGTQHGPTVKRRMVGLGAGDLADPEGIARIDTQEGGIELIVASSLCVWSDLAGNHFPCDGLVRVRYRANGDLHAQAMHGFRHWLVTGYPALDIAAGLTPNQGGLNIEGLAWDQARSALLFGVRCPVTASQILVLCIYLDTDAPWNTAALQIGPTLSIAKADFPDPQGIRDIDYDAVRQEFLVVVGRSISGGNAPFQLCTWDGIASTVNVLDYTFAATMKPEGVTAFPGNGPRKLLIVDDASGFAVLS